MAIRKSIAFSARRTGSYFSVLLAMTLYICAACSNGGDSSVATSTPTPSSTSTPDTTLPSVSITSPTTAATYTATSATLNLAGNAGDNVGVTGVTWNNNRGGSGTASGTTAWTVNGIVLQSGSNTLTVTAHDAAGNVRSDALAVSYSPSPPPDVTPPTVSITVPGNGQVVAGTYTVTANASDNVGVTQVQFELDGANLGVADTSSPYSVSWNTRATSNGAHSLTAVARDAAGNATTSASVTVTVSNTSSVPFTHAIIDNGFYGDCKAVGDINKDGYADVIVGGSELVWYRYPSWTKTLIASANEQFTTDMQVGDVDGDGDLDVIVPDGAVGSLLWFENPLPGGNPAAGSWARHVIGSLGTYVHDVEVGDVNGDGRLDVVTRKGDATLFLQNSPTSWTRKTVSTRQGEGISLGDIDGDGDLDIAINGYWIETPASPATGAWVEHTINTNWPGQVGVAIVDLNKDGRADVILAHTETAGRMAWYEAPVNPKTGVWTEHVIDASVDFVHTFKTADIDNDGSLDVVFAEMAQSTRKRVGFYLNGGNSLGWTLQVLSTSGSHNIRVIDIGNDGDIDVIGANWQGPPVEMWENLTSSP